MDIRDNRQKKIQARRSAICALWDKTQSQLDYPVPAITIFRFIGQKVGLSVSEVRRTLVKFGKYGSSTNKQAVAEADSGNCKTGS